MRFASPYDEAHFRSGPPAIFALDPRGQLRVDPERTREMYMVGEPGEREEGFYVLYDQATGVRVLLVVTHPCMAEWQPRGRVRRFPDYDSAVAEAVQQWSVAPADAVAGAQHES